MTIQEDITAKLRQNYNVHELSVINESGQHNVPVGSESHFFIFMVSDFFHKIPRVRRHQAIYKTLEHEMKNGIHALRMQLLSMDEASSESQKDHAPPCLGGSKGT